MNDSSRLKNRILGGEIPRSILIGHLPPPRIGPSIAFEFLIHFYNEMGLPFVVVDIGSRNTQRKIGRFEWRRATEVLYAITQYLKYVTAPHQVVYLTVAFSLVGFCRDFFIISVAKLRRHRIVLHFRGGGYYSFLKSLPRAMRWVVIQTLKWADCLIVLGEYLRKEMRGFMPDGSRITVVQNTIPREVTALPEAKIRQEGKPLRILYLSNMIESKGYWDLLEAIRQLKQQGKSVVADFAGAFMSDVDAMLFPDVTMAEKAFRDSLEDPLIAGAVRYHGVANGLQKAALLNDVDVFVLPTAYRLEGQPIALVEALASALPIICTENPNLMEIVQPGVNGFLVSPKNPIEIADCISRLYDSVELYNRMSAASLALYHRLYAPEIVKKKLLKAILGNEDMPDACWST